MPAEYKLGTRQVSASQLLWQSHQPMALAAKVCLWVAPLRHGLCLLVDSKNQPGGREFL